MVQVRLISLSSKVHTTGNMKKLLLVSILFYGLCSIVGLKTPCPTFRIKNGRARYRQKGSFVQSSCNTGFVLAGDKYLKCVKGQWGVLPQCVRDSCKHIREPLNGYVYPSHRGGVLHFYCKPDYQLIGPTTAYCDGTSWSTHVPTCQVSNDTASVNCDFESDNLCGWTHDLNHNFDWTRHSRSTPSAFIGTGPWYDHTFGSGNKGHYMYIEASGKNPKDTARLISPSQSFLENSTRKCLVFWYHMYGESMGQLRVYAHLISKPWVFNPSEVLWEAEGNHGAVWLQGTVELQNINEDFQIVFEGVRGGNYMSDMAIDDISIIDCEEILSTTTEQTSTDFIVSEVMDVWTCYGNCGIIPEGHLCSCTVDCYDQMSCCPDYEAYCLDVETTSQGMEISTRFMEIWSESPNSNIVTTNIAVIATEVEESATELDFVEVPPSNHDRDPKVPLDPLDPIVIKSRPIIPTPRPTNTSTTTTRTTTTKKRIALTLASKPTPIKTKPTTTKLSKKTPQQKKTQNEVRIETTSEIKEETRASKSAFLLFALIGCVFLIGIVVLLVVHKMRRRVVGTCQMRMRRGGSSDSQSDVRFLTSDEVLDFSIASSTL